MLLTTGDMAADREMMAHYNVSLSKIVRYNINTNDTGDGQKMGMDRRGHGRVRLRRPVAVRYVMMDGTAHHVRGHVYAGVANLPVLMVDGAPSPHGKACCSSRLPSKLTAPTAARGASGTAPGRRSSRGRLHGGGLLASTQEEDRTWRTASRSSLIPSRSCGTLWFRQGHLHCHVHALQRAVRGRRGLDFYKDPLWMNPIDTPPFYASKHCSSMTSTRGGLKNDERCRVLDKEGRPIPGLYAAGNTAGSFYGNVYPPNVMGSGIGHGQCFAWLAVKDILGLDYIHANI
ncbi:MAG: FAD-binding protein [Eggerthellaceae bacterium]